MTRNVLGWALACAALFGCGDSDSSAPPPGDGGGLPDAAQPDTGAAPGADGGDAEVDRPDARVADADSSDVDGGQDAGGPIPVEDCPTEWWSDEPEPLSFVWERPLPTGDNLVSVWASSIDAAWAVTEAGAIVRYEGDQWSIFAEEAGVDVQVRGSAADDVWFLGQSALARWNGITLESVTVPTSSDLVGLSVLAPDDVWVAGQDVVLHFDGLEWQSHSVATDITAIWASVGGSVWAATSSGEAWRLDDSSWTSETVSSEAGLTSVWGSGPDDVFFGSSRRATIYRWNGASVSSVYGTPNNFDVISDLSGAAPDDIWGIDPYSSGLTNGLPIVRYDGDSWDDHMLYGAAWEPRAVHALGAGRAWVVGEGGGRAFHDGAEWTSASPAYGHVHDIESLPSGETWAATDEGILTLDGGDWNLTPTDSPIYAIWARDAEDVWAVGSVILRWNGGEWTEQPRPAGAFQLLDVHGAGDELWVVSGSYRTYTTGHAHRWNGAEWEEHLYIRPGRGAVHVLGPEDVWVVTSCCVHRFDGVEWTTDELQGGAGGMRLAALRSGPSDAWVGGESLLHWDGTRYCRLPGPARAMTATGMDDVWMASGSDLRHWDGTVFRPVSVPTGNALFGVAANPLRVVGEHGSILRHTP